MSYVYKLHKVRHHANGARTTTVRNFAGFQAFEALVAHALEVHEQYGQLYVIVESDGTIVARLDVDVYGGE